MTETTSMFPEGTPIRRVIDYATIEFFAKGVKSVTMDSIAKGLQMSKRTLYQLFADKEQLIIACIEVMAEKEHKLAQSLLESEHNILAVLLHVIENRMRAFENVSSQYIYDISRHESIKEYIRLSKQKSYEHLENIFTLGIQQGLFRKDINVPLIMSYLFLRENNQSAANIFSNYSIPEMFINIGLFHLRGCCTAKGIELIDQFLDHYRKEQMAKDKH